MHFAGRAGPSLRPKKMSAAFLALESFVLNALNTKKDEMGMEKNSNWLAERAKPFSEVFFSVPDYCVMLIDPKGVIQTWNTGATALTGFEAREMIGEHFSALYCGPDQESDTPKKDLAEAASKKSSTKEGWRSHKSGNRFWASITITAIHSSDGEIQGFACITRDLTGRYERLEELRQSEERMRLLIESVTEYAIFLLDPTGRIMSWNEGARRIKGYEASEIIGQHISKFYTEDAHNSGLPNILLAKALQNGSASDEGWRVKKDGNKFWASIVITAVHSGSGEHYGYVKITRDLTERRLADELAKSHEEKDTFLATLAHELRNPIAPLAPGLDLIIRAPHETERVIKVATMMRRQVDLMSRLIEDLVDLSRITTGRINLRRERASLATVIEDSLCSIRPLVEKYRHRLIVEVEKDIPIFADPHRLTQALTNLLRNAVKYTESSGEIVLSAWSVDSQTLEISVRDNGRGIGRDVIEDIFDTFNRGLQTDTDGLGIGLSLTRAIVQLHGGKISVASEGVGKGSEFLMTLPIRERESLPETGAEKTRDEQKCRVLVVDDAKATADMLAMLLEAEGLDTSVAYTGEDAVEKAKEIRPDIGCLDIGLPGISGLETARLIREQNPNVVLIAITGWGTDKDRSKTKEAGFDYHMVKPISVDEFRKVLYSEAGHCFPRNQ